MINNGNMDRSQKKTRIFHEGPKPYTINLGKLSTKPDALSRRANHFKSDAGDNLARIIIKPEQIKIQAAKRGQAMIDNKRPLVQKIRQHQEMEDDVWQAVATVKNLGPKSLRKRIGRLEH